MNHTVTRVPELIPSTLTNFGVPGPMVELEVSKSPPLPQSTNPMASPISLTKTQLEMESPNSGDMDLQSCTIFERDHQVSFEQEILSVIECKDPEMESIESRWRRLHDKVMASANGTWKHDPKMVPPLQQCAADLFARMYFREFNAHPKNKKYMKKGCKAILTQMKVELSSLRVWSCVYKGLEWRVYDKFGDPEEVPTPEAQPVDMERTTETLKSWNLSWNLSGTACVIHSVETEVHKPTQPNISHCLPVIARPQIIQESPPRVDAQNKPMIRLRIRIPQRQPPPPEGRVIESIDSPRPPITISVPGTDVRGLENLPFFLRYLTLRCDRSEKLWRTPCSNLYTDYTLWAPKANAPAMGKNQIGAELRKYGIYSKVFNGKRHYVGIRIK